MVARLSEHWQNKFRAIPGFAVFVTVIHTKIALHDYAVSDSFSLRGGATFQEGI